MSKAPAFQLYARDFLADPLVDAMEPEELGGYFRLLLVAWQQEEPGYLPNDEKQLAAWSRLGRRWKKHGPAVMRCFRTSEDGRLYQKRMVEVASDQAEYREMQRLKGQASAAARAAAAAAREGNRGSTAVQPGHQPNTQPKGNSASASATAPKTVEREARAPSPGLLALWRSETGDLVPDAYQWGEVRSRVEAYAEAAELEPVAVLTRAIASFRDEVASWSNTRPLTAALFVDKWSEVQARMAGKVPASTGRGRGGASVMDPESVEKGRELLSDHDMNPLGMHFDEPWQREAWEAEIAERRRRQHEHEGPPADGGATVASLLEGVRPTLVPDAPTACGCPRMPMPSDAVEEYCDLEMHYRWNVRYACAEVVGRCAEHRRREAGQIIAREEEKLAGEIALLRRLGSIGFEGYDPTWCEGAAQALALARDFAAGRPPRRNVVMLGVTGLGKTRLMIASHFELLAAGVRSVYVTSPELRTAFQDQAAFDPELRKQGNTLVERVLRTQAVHLDDLGNVEDDERKRGQFAEGLKKVLDRSRAVWFAATNLTWDAAIRHPDVGEKVLSRLVNGAEVVKLSGKDYRVAHATRRR